MTGPDGQAEIDRLRDAVEHLAHTLSVGPAYLPPDRIWTDRADDRYGEWDVQANRCLSVRAGAPDGIPGVFLVDRHGEMHAMSIADSYVLIRAVTSATLYANGDLTRRRSTRPPSIAD